MELCASYLSRFGKQIICTCASEQERSQACPMMHLSVLLQEVVEALRVKYGETFLDCTVGSGGHSVAVAQAAHGPVNIIGLDEDEDALARAKKRFEEAGIRASLIQKNFRHLDAALTEARASAPNAILMDLGVSTDELLASGRGFSFNTDEPLLMSFRKSPEREGLTARQVVNEWGEENLETILRGFGGERYAKRIARAIAVMRKRAPLETSKALADIVSSVVPRSGKTHPATKTFQAIRMAVNDELPALGEGLRKALATLKSGGRIAVISFHSGEDRIVKQFFKEAEKNGIGNTSKKPIVPSQEEVRSNPRSRSAKLRVFTKK